MAQLTPALELQFAQSQLTKTEADDLAALRAEQTFLEKALKDKRLSVSQRVDLTNQLADVDQQIAALTDKHRKKKHKRARHQPDPRGAAARRLEVATHEGRRGRP